MTNFDVTVLDASSAITAIDQLAEVLVDCVAGGASVSFMAPFRHDDAVAFFRKVIASIKRDETVLVAALIEDRVLDTASDDAERLYARAGWQQVGVIPDYALWPGGGLCDTTVFWKRV